MLCYDETAKPFVRITKPTIESQHLQSLLPAFDTILFFVGDCDPYRIGDLHSLLLDIDVSGRTRAQIAAFCPTRLGV